MQKSNLIKNCMLSILFSFVATLPSFCVESQSVGAASDGAAPSDPVYVDKTSCEVRVLTSSFVGNIKMIEASNGDLRIVLLDSTSKEIFRLPFGKSRPGRTFYPPLFSVDGKVVAIFLDNDDSSKWSLKCFSSENGSLVREYRLVCCDKKPVFTQDKLNIFVCDEEAEAIKVYKFCEERMLILPKEPVEMEYFNRLLGFKKFPLAGT